MLVPLLVTWAVQIAKHIIVTMSLFLASPFLAWLRPRRTLLFRRLNKPGITNQAFCLPDSLCQQLHKLQAAWKVFSTA
jgi:hypothetical protein